MTEVSEVQSLMYGLAGSDRFKLLQTVDDLDVEVWQLVKDSKPKQIFGTDKEKQKSLLIPRSRIDNLYKAVAEAGNVQDYSMIFLFNDHGRYKVLEVRRATGMDPNFKTHVITKEDWVLGSSQGYVLIIPKLS